MLDVGLVPIYTAPDLASALGVVRASRDAGARVVEFTNRGAGAYDVFGELAATVRRDHPDVILGVGTIVDAPTAALFVAAGAAFVVGPTLSREVALLCNRRRVPYLPGCLTATEISDAEELGCEIVKLFPQASIDGPAFVRNLLGPMPGSRVMPTNISVEPAVIRAWIEAGAAALGAGGALVSPDILARADWAELSSRTEAALRALREARAQRDAPDGGG